MTRGRRKATSAALERKRRNGAGADAGADGVGSGEVYERLWGAIIDHSLPPGTRLIEERLCEIFALGRTRLRQVLQRLAHERVVTLMPNRGAMVSKPSAQEAREVFAARRVIEAGTVSAFLANAARPKFKRLHEHLARERTAWRENDRRAAVRLSGEFHLIIAECAGNAILLEILRDLVSRSSLIIAMFQTPGGTSCPPDEHEQLAAALERRDARSVELMLQHLDQVLSELHLESIEPANIDLRSVLTRDLRRAPIAAAEHLRMRKLP
jgi:DNA-binding GntR family transcriptional regulator